MNAYESLHTEFLSAVENDPAQMIYTPGFDTKWTSAMDVWADQYAGSNGDELLHETIRTIGLAAKGENVALRAQALIAQFATKHASFHREDAEELERFLEDRHGRAQSRRFDGASITGFGGLAA